jgi:hypothetical protein
MGVIKDNWFIIVFILGATFSLGGYAVMIGILRKHVNTLFDKNREQEKKMTDYEVNHAVLQEKTENLCQMVSEQKGMLQNLLTEVRRRNGYQH